MIFLLVSNHQDFFSYHFNENLNIYIFVIAERWLHMKRSAHAMVPVGIEVKTFELQHSELTVFELGVDKN